MKRTGKKTKDNLHRQTPIVIAMAAAVMNISAITAVKQQNSTKNYIIY